MVSVLIRQFSLLCQGIVSSHCGTLECDPARGKWLFCLFHLTGQLTVVICRCFKPVSICSCVISPPLVDRTSRLIYSDLRYHMALRAILVQSLWFLFDFLAQLKAWMPLLKCFFLYSCLCCEIYPLRFLLSIWLCLFKRNQAFFDAPVNLVTGTPYLLLQHTFTEP